MASLPMTSSSDLRPRLRTSSSRHRSWDEILDNCDVRALETVEAPHGEIELLDGHLKYLVPLRLRLSTTVDLLPTLSERSVKSAKWSQRIFAPSETASARVDGAVRPDLQGQLVKIRHASHTGGLHGVIDLIDRRVDGVDGITR